MSGYSVQHKQFLQIILGKRLLEEKRVKEIHKTIFKDKSNMDETIKLINSKINKLNLKIDKIICEFTGKTCIVIYPMMKPKFSMLDVMLSLASKEFMSLVYQGIISSPDGFISTSTALNYANSLKNKGLKMIEAEDLIENFISNNLLMYTNDKQTNICFTPLTILEMDHEFRESFSDYVADCSLCKRTVFHGVTCSNCNDKVHWHCLKNFSSTTNKSGVSKCPGCNSVIATKKKS